MNDDMHGLPTGEWSEQTIAGSVPDQALGSPLDLFGGGSATRATLKVRIPTRQRFRPSMPPGGRRGALCSSGITAPTACPSLPTIRAPRLKPSPFIPARNYASTGNARASGTCSRTCRRNVGTGFRHIFRRTRPCLPDRRMGIRPVPSLSGSRNSGRTVRRSRGALHRTGRATAAELGWLHAVAAALGILAGRPKPSALSLPVHAGRQRLDARNALSVNLAASARPPRRGSGRLRMLTSNRTTLANLVLGSGRSTSVNRSVSKTAVNRQKKWHSAFRKVCALIPLDHPTS